MLKAYAMVLATFAFMRTRLEQAKSDERGLTTLEIAVIGLGLFLLAGAVVAVIVAAVNSRTNQIQ